MWEWMRQVRAKPAFTTSCATQDSHTLLHSNLLSSSEVGGEPLSPRTTHSCVSTQCIHAANQTDNKTREFRRNHPRTDHLEDGWLGRADRNRDSRIRRFNRADASRQAAPQPTLNRQGPGEIAGRISSRRKSGRGGGSSRTTRCSSSTSPHAASMCWGPHPIRPSCSWAK